MEGKDFAGKWWIIFFYLCIDDQERRRQWEKLKDRQQKWLISGDFNEILGPVDKNKERERDQ